MRGGFESGLKSMRGGFESGLKSMQPEGVEAILV